MPDSAYLHPLVRGSKLDQDCSLLSGDAWLVLFETHQNVRHRMPASPKTLGVWPLWTRSEFRILVLCSSWVVWCWLLDSLLDCSKVNWPTLGLVRPTFRGSLSIRDGQLTEHDTPRLPTRQLNTSATKRSQKSAKFRQNYLPIIVIIAFLGPSC